jgi:pimeloyl-ACP methyl ester carboxylesterase
MSELSIQYTKTDDGAAIAYAVAGHGPPMVRMHAFVTTFATEWRDPVFGVFHHEMSAQYQTLLYDGRGSGMSQRDAADMSMEARLRDLDAVIRAAGFSELVLYGYE